MGRYFGTDGYRGKAYDVLTIEHAYRIGRFLGFFSWLAHESSGSILIGMDTRESGKDYEEAIARGALENGADVYLMGVTTTPAVAYTTKQRRFPYGVMISASHNPYYDNGIKIIDTDGNKVNETLIKKIEDYIDGIIKDFPVSREAGQIHQYPEGNLAYVEYLESLCVRNYNCKNIALDCANGSSYSIAKEVFGSLGANLSVINDEPNGKNINNNCGSTHIEGLQKLVVEKHLDVGFAFDGDADRCLAVDEKGNVVNGDQIIYMYAKYMKDSGRLTNNEIVTTVMANMGLYKALKNIGVSYHTTPVGDKYVREYMVSNGNLVGGEQSGHIIFSKYASTGDGILTAIKVMQVMVSTGRKLSELVEDCIVYPQVLINVKVSDKTKAMSDDGLKRVISICEDDLGMNGRVLVRESGTEPLVRVMVEAETSDICNMHANKIAEVIRKKYGVD